MKKWKIAAAAACVCFLFTVAYAANASGAGSSGDPLVTLSYLNGTFAGQVQAMVDEAVNQRKAEMEQSLNDLLSGQGGQGGASSGDGAVFTTVTLGGGQALVCDAGCEVLLRNGAAVCASTGGAGLVDTTSGGSLAEGGGLAANHLYLASVGGSTVAASSDTVEVMVRGGYTIV